MDTVGCRCAHLYVIFAGALVILNALIIKESSAVDGGGIGVAGGAHVIMNSGSIANCEATNNGGGFYVYASSIIASSIILNDVEVGIPRITQCIIY